MNLHRRIDDFIESLDTYPPKDHPAGQVADIFNALHDAVKKEHGDDPIVAAIRPARTSQNGKSEMDAGSLIAVARQLRGAVPDPDEGPMIG